MEQIDNPEHGYKLPDHWVAHERYPNDVFTMLHSAYVGRAIEIIKKSGARTVLEVGCGDGWNCGQMVDAGLDVVGIDWSIRGTAYAAALVPKAQFSRADVTSPEFHQQFPDKFDAVALIEVIEHIRPNECVQAIRNIVAPLKSGGTFVLTTPSENLPLEVNELHYQHFTEKKLRDMITACGLKVVSIEGYGNVPAIDTHWRKMRWADNRFYSIKPLMRYFDEQRGRIKLTGVPLTECSGLILTAIKNG